MSTILYAPQVRAIQPAFEYNTKDGTGEMKVYFSFSSYNNIKDITGIRYSLIDPNQGANNSTIIKPKEENGVVKNFDSDRNVYYKYVSEDELCLGENGAEYYFTITFDDTFNTMKLDQYYQLQIWLTNSNMGDFLETAISQVSQVSLIRPFCGIKDFIVEGLSDNEAFAPSLDSLMLPARVASKVLSSFDTLTGELILKEPLSKEYLKEYYYTIEDFDNNIVYSSPYLTAGTGSKFNTKLNYVLIANQYYAITFYYTTINDFKGSRQYQLWVAEVTGESQWEDNDRDFKLKVEQDVDLAAAKIDLQFTLQKDMKDGVIKIQRADEDSNFYKWMDVSSFKIKEEDSGNIGYCIFKDYFIESDKVYKYRVAYWSSEQNTLIQNPLLMSKEYEISISTFEHIYLLDKDCLMVIQYSPKVNSIKWVTQESLTNTLGGKFPTVRQNGDTYYKQMTISGILYFPNEKEIDAVDSCGNPLSSHWGHRDFLHGLYFSRSAFANLLQSNIKGKNKEMLERRVRDEAMKFLTNKKPKVFKSAEEGNMIVYLSNVNFTPNQSLGRRIIDFSATMTEVCEASTDNLKNFIFEDKLSDIYTYSLNIKSIENRSAYIDASKLYNNALIFDAKEVGKRL